MQQCFTGLFSKITKASDLQTRNALIEQCIYEVVLPLARHWHAMAFYAKGNPASIEVHDLVSEGTLIILESLKEAESRDVPVFDDFAESTYKKILEKIEKAILREEAFEDFSRRLCENLNDLASVKIDLEQKLNRRPSPTEIAKEMKMRGIRIFHDATLSDVDAVVELERIYDLALGFDKTSQVLARETLCETITKIIRK